MWVGTVLFRVLENVPDCHPHYTAATRTPVLMTKHVFRHCQMSFNGVCLVGAEGSLLGENHCSKMQVWYCKWLSKCWRPKVNECPVWVNYWEQKNSPSQRQGIFAIQELISLHWFCKDLNVVHQCEIQMLENGLCAQKICLGLLLLLKGLDLVMY